MEEETVVLLKEIGLTEYETKSFLTLLQLGIATAEQISETAGIPLPRVYDTLVELQKKGFVLISKGRPKKFKPIPPKRALKNFIESKKNEYEKEVSYLKDTTKKLENSLSKLKTIEIPKERDWSVWSTTRRKNVIKNIQDIAFKSKKEILIFSGDLSWLPEVAPDFRCIIKKGVKIRAVCHHPKDSRNVTKNINLAKRIGIKIKTGFTGALRGQVVDGDIASIATKRSERGINVIENGQPGSELENIYELMLFNNPSIIEAFKEYFEFWWKKLA